MEQMIHTKTAHAGWWACAAFLGIGLFGALCWSESSREEAQINVAQGQVFSTRDLTIIQDRLAQLTDSHRQLLQATEEIKRELAIIKVRVTN